MNNIVGQGLAPADITNCPVPTRKVYKGKLLYIANIVQYFFVFDNMCIQNTLEIMIKFSYNRNMRKILVTIFTILLIFSGCAEKPKNDGMRATLTAMGTVVSYNLNGAGGEVAFSEIDKVFEEIEKACSLTKEGSAINSLNLSGQTDNLYIVEQAKLFEEYNLLKISEGKFDLTAGALTTLWDIGFSGKSVPENIDDALKDVDGSKTKIENNVFYIGENQKIDLGGVTKGYALDKAKEILEKNDVSGVITLGGSVLFYGKNPKKDNWTCAVKNPFNTSEYLGVISLKEGFVSTSGSYERFFEENGKVYHHIIDATDGYPFETDIVSVTIICDNGFLSDALSTICFLSGIEKSREIIKQFNASAIFVDKDQNITILGDVDFEAY